MDGWMHEIDGWMSANTYAHINRTHSSYRYADDHMMIDFMKRLI